LTELKSFGSPPPAVINVAAAVMCLLAPGGKIPKDKSWKAAKSSIMSKVGFTLKIVMVQCFFFGELNKKLFN
jgi:dynein heavy chain